MTDQNREKPGGRIEGEPKTVLILHSKEQVADILLSFFRALPILAARATSPEEATKLFDVMRPDLVVVGVNRRWLSLLGPWRDAQPQLDIIMLAESEEIAEDAQRMGFENVALTDDDPESLAETIDCFLEGGITTFPPPNAVDILVVDDEADALNAVARYLAGCGYNIFRAESGKAALEILARVSTISIAVLDLVMPTSGGMETLRQMKSHDANLGVIIMSSFADREIVRHALNLGAFDFLLKPVDVNLLESSVVACLAHRDYGKLPWWKR